MNETVLVDWGQQSRHRTGLLEGCVVSVKDEPCLGYEGHATTGVEDGRTEAGEMRVWHAWCVWVRTNVIDT